MSIASGLVHSFFGQSEPFEVSNRSTAFPPQTDLKRESIEAELLKVKCNFHFLIFQRLPRLQEKDLW